VNLRLGDAKGINESNLDVASEGALTQALPFTRILRSPQGVRLVSIVNSKALLQFGGQLKSLLSFANSEALLRKAIYIWM